MHQTLPTINSVKEKKKENPERMTAIDWMIFNFCPKGEESKKEFLLNLDDVTKQIHMASEMGQLQCLAEIRAMVGDPEGRLMQDELIKKIESIVSVVKSAKCIIPSDRSDQISWHDEADEALG